MKTLRSLDSFDRYVTLKYHNESKYKTLCGGLVTILIFILMVAYIIILITNKSEETSTIKVSNITNDSDTTQVIGDTEFNTITDFKRYDNYKTMTENPIEYNLTLENWYVAIMLSKPYNTSLFDVFFYINYRDSINENSSYAVLPLTI